MSSRGRGYKRPRWDDYSFAAARRAVLDAALSLEVDAFSPGADERRLTTSQLRRALAVMDHEEQLRRARGAREGEKHREYRDAIRRDIDEPYRDWRGHPNGPLNAKKEDT